VVTTVITTTVTVTTVMVMVTTVTVTVTTVTTTTTSETVGLDRQGRITENCGPSNVPRSGTNWRCRKVRRKKPPEHDSASGACILELE
jgi:hypothetical protein